MIKGVETKTSTVVTTNQNVQSTCEDEEQIIDFSTEKKPEKETFMENCTDGVDDGKLSLGEKAKSFKTGITNKIKNQLKNIFSGIFKENRLPVVVAGALLAGITFLAGAAGFTTLIAGLGYAVTGFGIYNIIKTGKEMFDSSKEAKNATTDVEAKQAYAKIGGKSFEMIENIGLVSGGVQCIKSAHSVKSLKNVSKHDITHNLIDNAEDACRHSTKCETIKGAVDEAGDAIGEISGEIRLIRSRLKEQFSDENKTTITNGIGTFMSANGYA